MRHARSDSFKIAIGTLQPRWSEEARAKRAVDNVLTFPQLTEIPQPSVLLVPGGNGEQAYRGWCEWLLRKNLLTAVSIGFVETLALAEDKIELRFHAGKDVPDRTLEIRRSILLKFDALGDVGAIIPDNHEPNKFANNGFPARKRAEERKRSAQTHSSGATRWLPDGRHAATASLAEMLSTPNCAGDAVEIAT